MLSWTPQVWARERKCDAPDCQNETSPDHCLIARPVVGPALDIPLRLFFCQDHRDIESLFEQYRSARRRDRAAAPPDQVPG